jgi:hypothetical protein
MKGYYPAHPHLFTLREVADAIYGSPKVIRAAARAGMIKSERLPSEKSRKLFFKLAAIRRFRKSYPLFSEQSGVFRSEKIALDPRVVRGDAVTIEHAMIELVISRRGVQYYLKCGILKKIKLGARTILITRESLARHCKRNRARISKRRLNDEERRIATAKKNALYQGTCLYFSQALATLPLFGKAP